MNNGDIHIRQYRPADYIELTALWQQLGLGRPERGDTQEVIENTLSRGGRLYIAEKDDHIVGTAWVTNNGRRLYLHHMGVADHMQRKGIAKMLMEAILAFASSEKMQIKLEVHQTNYAARKLYEKYGFGALGGYEVLIKREP